MSVVLLSLLLLLAHELLEDSNFVLFLVFIPNISHKNCLWSRCSTKFQKVNKEVLPVLLLRQDFLGRSNNTRLNRSPKSHIMSPNTDFRNQLY